MPYALSDFFTELEFVDIVRISFAERATTQSKYRAHNVP